MTLIGAMELVGSEVLCGQIRPQGQDQEDRRAGGSGEDDPAGGQGKLRAAGHPEQRGNLGFPTGVDEDSTEVDGQIAGQLNHSEWVQVRQMENQEAYQRAKKRVEAKIGFYIHLAVYVGVNVLLILINLSKSPEYLWFKWPLMGWGIGIFFHGMSVFVFSSGKFEATKEKMIQEEMKKGSPKQ